MKNSRYLECLAADATRLREVAAQDLGAPVPSCPGWTVTDLVRHTTQVYLHKAETMRRGDWPRPWPPDLSAEEPIAAFERSYAELIAEFAAREPEDPTLTWFDPDQTVGFWVRRMAQETVIHRVDAELALGAERAPIPTDLAIDGVDEVLVAFLEFGTTQWAEDFGEALTGADGRSVRVSTGPASWVVRLAATGAEVTARPPVLASATPPRRPEGLATDDPAVAATVSGEPADVLLWLWRRVGADAVTVSGEAAVVDRLHRLLEGATQ